MIIVENSRIIIKNYNLGMCELLESYLSVWDKNTYSYTFKAFIYDDEKEELVIPGGFNLDKLREFFPNKEVQYNIQDNKYRKINFSLKYPTRSVLQNQAINFLLQEKMKQKFLCLETGGGKTYCSIHYVFRTKKLPMTFVDQDSIMSQWKDRIMYFTDIEEDEIYCIKGRDSVEKLMNMKQNELSKYKWFIVVHRTLSNFYLDDPNNITKLFNKLKIGIKLYDEAHVEMKNIFHMDCCTNCESIYITATPSRSNTFENKVYKNMFWDVPKFIESGHSYHNVIIYKYNTQPSAIDETTYKGRYGFDLVKWASRYLTEENNYLTFYETIEAILKMVTRKNRHKIAILLPNIELCDRLYNDVKELNILPDYTIGKFHSKVKNKTTELEKDLIITTDKSFGKALDVKDLSICINTVPLSSESKTLQMMGRLREIPNKEVFYIDVIDEGFTQQRRQLTTKMKIYKKKCKKIYNIKK